MLILLVDDDESTLFVLSRLLGSLGHEVDSCSNGLDALTQLKRKPYSVLLTDLVMPSMNGLDLVRAARSHDAGLFCVVITGHEAPEPSEREGASWLRKPLNVEDLLDLLEAHAKTAS